MSQLVFSIAMNSWVPLCMNREYIDAVSAVVKECEVKKCVRKLVYQFCRSCSHGNETAGQVSCWHSIHRYVLLNDDCNTIHMDVTHKFPNSSATYIQKPDTIYFVYMQTTPKKIAEWQFCRPAMNKTRLIYICTAAHNAIWETRSKNLWNSKNNYFAHIHTKTLLSYTLYSWQYIIPFIPKYKQKFRLT